MEAQRAADRAAPSYVSGELRNAHTRLVAAEQHLRDSRIALAAAQHHATTLTTPPPATPAPAWWRPTAARTRTATEQHAAAVDSLRAQILVDELSARLDHARARVTAAADDVAILEERHRDWNTWYQQALPIRYAGLAAAAESTRRAHNLAANTRQLADAARQTADRVHAVDATRPNQHTTPVRPQLADQAVASQHRVADTTDPDLPHTETPDLDLGRD
jgi:hypothetical protein